MGEDSGRIISIGQRATVRIVEAAPVTGGLELELLALENTALPRGRPGGKSRSPKRKLVKHKRKTDKTKRKVARRRR